MAFLCRGAVKSLKKKGNEDNFEFLKAFDKGDLRHTLQRLVPQEPEFYGVS